MGPVTSPRQGEHRFQGTGVETEARREAGPAGSGAKPGWVSPGPPAHQVPAGTSSVSRVSTPCRPQFPRIGPDSALGAAHGCPSCSASSIPSSSPSSRFHGNPILRSAARSCVPIFSLFHLFPHHSVRSQAPSVLCCWSLASFSSLFYLLRCSLVISGQHLFIFCLKKKKKRKEGGKRNPILAVLLLHFSPSLLSLGASPRVNSEIPERTPCLLPGSPSIDLTSRGRAHWEGGVPEGRRTPSWRPLKMKPGQDLEGG